MPIALFLGGAAQRPVCDALSATRGAWRRSTSARRRTSRIPLALERRAADRHQLALVHDRKSWMTGNHRLPPIQARRSKAFAKKSGSIQADRSWHAAGQSRRHGSSPAPGPSRNLGELLDRLTLPRSDLGRMDFVLGRQLRHRLVALDRLCDLTVF